MTRAETIKGERRRRNTDALGGVRGRLSVSGQLDYANYVYRWVNDDKTRIEDMTVRDDWEIVSNRGGDFKPDAQSIGSEVSLPAGVGDGGRPIRAILMRKPKAYHDEDRAAKQRAIDATETGMKQGAAPGAGNDRNTYVPSGGIVFDHGSRS